MRTAQLVIGPPGSGKTTYTNGLSQFLTAIHRRHSTVNLDPANDNLTYTPALDVRSLVALDDIMAREQLGPNGGVLWAIEELEANFNWLAHGLERLEDYLIVDCPGQVELFTHHDSMPRIFRRLEKLGYRLVVVQLLDSLALTRPSLYLSSLLLALRAMLHLPHPLVNVFTKIDNLASTGGRDLPFALDFYTDVQDLGRLLPHLARESGRAAGKFAGLDEALVALVEDYGLVGFETLAVEDRGSMASLLRAVDRASGYFFAAAGAESGGDGGVWATVMRDGWPGKMDVRDVQERWIERREEMDELERSGWAEEAAKRSESAAGRGTFDTEDEARRELDGRGGGDGEGDVDADVDADVDEDGDGDEDGELARLRREFETARARGEMAAHVVRRG